MKTDCVTDAIVSAYIHILGKSVVGVVFYQNIFDVGTDAVFLRSLPTVWGKEIRTSEKKGLNGILVEKHGKIMTGVLLAGEFFVYRTLMRVESVG